MSTSSGNESRNTYMEEVLQQQQVVAQELKARKMPLNAPAQMARGRMALPQQMADFGGGPTGGERAIDVRVTGWWRWQTVIVPPNAWVVHTRRGFTEPLHMGIGVSFRFNPYTDTYLVAPATMQTLAINAKCICKERQGILVQAYVQWIVEDFKGAYKKLDFSDVDDPVRVVNVQLREQAEASIKDKVATMSIDDVLADKRPIIDELTARLRSVAEGQGLKIVQVQIKEAVISSTRLWENLQKEFREQQVRIARMAELDRERAVREREIKDQTETDRAQMLASSETERLRRQHEVDLQKSRAALEEERVKAELQQIQAQERLDDAREKAALTLLEREIDKKRVTHDAQLARDRASIEVDAVRRKVENDVTDGRIQELLVRSLPQLLAATPKPNKHDVVHISSNGGDNDGVLAVAGLVKAVRAVLANGKDAPS